MTYLTIVFKEILRLAFQTQNEHCKRRMRALQTQIDLKTISHPAFFKIIHYKNKRFSKISNLSVHLIQGVSYGGV